MKLSMLGIVLLTLTLTQGGTRPIAHRETVKKFLSENPSYVQMTEFDPATLKAMRDEWGFGKNFTPYYATGDFNADGRKDFATILAFDKGKGALEPHVLIFNGTNQGTFQLAYNGREQPSPGLFIATMRTG